ncbi:hypothetical protein DV735_g1789, partial [Chaetothyriales sp. CBS 134920]
MAAVAQCITILDKSNKVVGTTKQLKHVFKEAKAAYLERRAEIHADKKAQEDHELRRARRAVEAMTIDESDARSRASDHSRHRGQHRQRDQGSSASVRSGHSDRSCESRSRHAPVEEHSRSAHAPKRSSHELVRRATDNATLVSHRQRQLSRSYTAPEIERHIDMDLAYGEFHPASLAALGPLTGERAKKQELSSLVTKCKMLLDEANCAQHSVKATIAHLQQNPEAMAAVALTLAEISNIASHMAPSALAMIKGSAPSVFAMLAAPEFLIAVGVGVGLTVVMFGGYKIIKKIQAKAKEGSAGMDEAIEVGQLDRIECWRRGIADADADAASVVSHNTSVEGEFITPMAARSMGHLPPPPTSHGGTDGKARKKKKHHRREDGSTTGSTSNRSTSTRRSSKTAVPRERSVVKMNSSPLRSMLRV